MGIVEFLEARITEEEAAIREGTLALDPSEVATHRIDDKASLSELMMEECAQKRAIVASWKDAAHAEGIEDPAEAEGTVAIARRAVLTILAGAHRGHPDYDPGWSPDLPTDAPRAPVDK